MNVRLFTAQHFHRVTAGGWGVGLSDVHPPKISEKHLLKQLGNA